MNTEQRQVLREIAASHPEPVGNSIHLKTNGRTHQQTIFLVGRLLRQGFVQAVVVQVQGYPDYLRIQLTAAGMAAVRERLRKKRWLFYVMLVFLLLPLLTGMVWLVGVGSVEVLLYVQVHWRWATGLALGCLGIAGVMVLFEPWR